MSSWACMWAEGEVRATHAGYDLRRRASLRVGETGGTVAPTRRTQRARGLCRVGPEGRAVTGASAGVSGAVSFLSLRCFRRGGTAHVTRCTTASPAPPPDEDTSARAIRCRASAVACPPALPCAIEDALNCGSPGLVSECCADVGRQEGGSAVGWSAPGRPLRGGARRRASPRPSQRATSAQTLQAAEPKALTKTWGEREEATVPVRPAPRALENKWGRPKLPASSLRIYADIAAISSPLPSQGDRAQHESSGKASPPPVRDA